MLNVTRVYLACPYSSPDESVRRERHHAANIAAAALMNKGYVVFSPISMSHPIAKACTLPGDWEFWERQDVAFLEWADELHVLRAAGWASSTGVAAEIRRFREMGKPVLFIDIPERG
jgi:nucleoside 2-deoxyribosyltransferase